jgi:hydrogenase/urease accessory protein HupE
MLGPATVLAAQLAALPGLRAHDPGLSSIELELRRPGVRARLTLARADAALVAAGSEGGTAAGEAWEVAERRDAGVLARELLEVEIDGAPALGAARVRADAGNVELRVDYPGSPSTRLSIRSRVFARLPRGHRQYLSLRDASGRVVADQLLEAGAERFTTTLDGARQTGATPATRFLALGVEHIVTGWDHLVFLLGVLLAGTGARMLLRIVTSFTIAHSVTLGLGAAGILAPPPRLVESAIALSIVYVGLENIFSRNLERRWLLTFVFGLVHGFGFAAALRDLGFDSDPGGIATALLSFNLGVELGQLAVAMLFLPAVWRFRERPAFSVRWAPACSGVISLAGLYWFVERMTS